MNIKRGWVVFFIVVVLVILFFNLKYLGLSVLNTSSNVTVGSVNSYPYFNLINNSLFVCEENKLYYEFNATDPDGNPLTGSISPQNPFFLFWILQQSPNTHLFAIVSGTLDKGDLGGTNVGSKLYQETVSINDGYNSTCCTNSTNVNITIIEINNAPTIEDVGVKTIWTQGENSTLYEVVSGSDTEYSNGYGSLTFNISITNSSGSLVNLFNISSSGVIDFTANSSIPVGVYNITVCDIDTGLNNTHQNISSQCGQTGASRFACDNFSLTVTNANRAPTITSYFPINLSFSSSSTSTIFFNATKYDPDGTIPDSYWYVDGVLKEYDSENLTDNFNYSFGCGVSGNHTVIINVTDGLLSTYLNWTINVQSVSCGEIGGGGAGSGGGGGASITSKNFEITPDFVTASILKEEGKSFDLTIKNTGDTVLDINYSIANLSDMAILSEENITLKVGEEKKIRLYLYALSNARPGVYFGKITFFSGSVFKDVFVVLEVKERQPLFDIKVSVPREFKSVNAGQDIKALIDMLNVGLYGTNVDVEFFISITSLDKLVLYQSSKEIVAVQRNLSLERWLHVPIDTVSGTYIVLVEARYNNTGVSTYDTFNVVEKKYLRATYIIIILAIIALILFIIFILWKRRKKKKEEQ